MPKTLRNKYYKNLTYEKLMQAHIKSRKGKNKSIWQKCRILLSKIRKRNVY